MKTVKNPYRLRWYNKISIGKWYFIVFKFYIIFGRSKPSSFYNHYYFDLGKWGLKTTRFWIGRQL